MSYVQLFSVGTLPSNLAGDFSNAVNFWNNVITGGAGTLVLGSAFELSGCGLPGLSFGAGTDLGGVSIIAQITAIDGTGGVLGSAGPCAFDNQNFARIGVMTFDSADANNLDNNGQFEEVVRHEMAHVLGMGTLWQNFGLLNGAGGNNPVYTGAGGRTGLARLGGSGNVPVANTGGAGTRDGHWREATFQNELMTGFLSAGTNPASIMTVKSLEDMGFSVNENAAQAYSIPGRRSGEEAYKGLEMTNDLTHFDMINIEEFNKLSAEEQGVLGKTFTEVTRVEIAQAGSDNMVLFSGVALFAAAFLALIALVVVKKQKKSAEVEEVTTEAQV